jgi:hypothetical protein
MSDGASLLAPNPGPVLQLDPAQPDPLASYSPAQQQPPVSVGDQPATNVTAPPQTPVQTIDTPSTGMVPGVDPEAYVGAVHQRQVAGFLSKALSVLAGDTVHHVVTNPDGSIAVHLDEATNKEKWGRIAAAVLGGAAKGMGVGQGPGGGGRAVAAGEQFGQQIPQQQADSANKEAEAQQQIRTRNANNALLNQKIVQGAFNNDHLDNDYKQAQQAKVLETAKQMQDLGLQPLAMGVKDSATIARLGAANPTVVSAHMGANGDMVYNEPDGKGGVNFYHIPANAANMATTTPDKGTMLRLDPEDPTKTIEDPFTIGPGEKVGARLTRKMALNVQNDNVIKTAAANKNAQQETNIKDREATLKEQAAPAELNEMKARTGQAWSESTLNKSKNEVIQNTLQQKPGGEPTEVQDPQFPSPNNFPVGTIGIAPAPKSGGYKVPAEAERAYRLSGIMNDSGNLIRQTATQNPQLFGRMQGLLSQGKTVVGLSGSKDDQAIATLAGAIQQYAQASAGFHTFRNKAAPAETEESSLNKFRNDPASIVAYLDSQKPAITQTERLIKNYQIYGTPQGPSDEARQAAVMRAPNAAKFTTQQTTQPAAAQTTTPPAAAATTPPAAATPPAVAPPASAGPTFKAMPVPPNEPVHPGRQYGMGPKGVGWYK